MALCRELTKRHEEIIRGTVADVRDAIDGRALKGEIVVVVGARPAPEVSGHEVEEALRGAMETMRIKDAATEVAARFGLPRREVYQMALALGARR